MRRRYDDDDEALIGFLRGTGVRCVWRWRWWRQRWWGGQGLCVDLCGGGLLVDGLLPQIVAALVLLLHAVDEEEDEEDGEHQADGAARDQGWKRQTRARFLSMTGGKIQRRG